MKRSTSPSSGLAALPPFSKCSHRQLRELDRVTCDLDVPAGTVLATQGRRAGQYVVIVGGWAVETVDGRPIASVGAGDDIGGVSLVENTPHSTSICAATPMQLQVIAPCEFRAAYLTVPALRTHVDDESLRSARRSAQSTPRSKVVQRERPFGYTLVS